jgi:OFA family oxalate/formate antiporter-like MFS transporter
MKWFPGYSVAAVSAVALVLTAPGQTLLVSLLNVPLRETFDIEPLWLNSSYAVATVLASLPLVWMGKLVDRFGPRKMMVAISIAFGGACLFTAAVAHVAMVVVAFFLLRFLGQGSLSMASGHALAMWFHRRLGTVSGLRSVVLFAVWAPLPALTLWMFGAFGWRATWAIYGVFVALTVSLLSWMFVRDRPEELGLKIDGESLGVEQPLDEPGYTLREAMRTRAYWVLAFGTALSPMISTAVIFDIQPMLGARGVDAGAAALAVSAWSATMAIMALPSGWLVDRIAPGRIMASGAAAIAAGCVLLVITQRTSTALGALSTLAVGNTLLASAVSATAARYFGRKHHGAIRSSLGRTAVIATGLGPLLFGLSQHFSGAFDVALVGFVALCTPAVVGSLWLAPPPQLKT